MELCRKIRGNEMNFWDFADKHPVLVGLSIFFVCWAVIGVASSWGSR